MDEKTPTTQHRIDAADERPEYLDVLVVCSAPVNVGPPLNLGQELAGLQDNVRGAPIPVRLRRVFPPTFEQLQCELSPTLLRLRRPRVLHFLGHGDEDGLWFENVTGAGDLVPTAKLSELLKGSPLELAILNACWSDSPRVVSLCDNLVDQGAVRAAIGHARPVADETAIAFADRFYPQLVHGVSVREAFHNAVKFAADKGLPGSSEITLRGDHELSLGTDLEAAEHTGSVEDGMPRRGYLPGSGFFCGRAEEFLTIAESLGERGRCAFGIWGIGGIGKTALVREVARRNAWRYREGGVVWVSVRDLSPRTMLALIERTLARLHPAGNSTDPAADLIRHLGAAPGMLIFDELEQLDEAEHDALARFIDQMPRNGSRVLLTSRTRIETVEELADAQFLNLTRGLDEWHGAFYAYHVAKAKDVKVLQELPLVNEHRVRGYCSHVSQRVSGHPKMIELAVGIARNGVDRLETALQSLRGDLQTKFDKLVDTGLAMVGEEGTRLFSYFPFFPTGRFLKEAMGLLCHTMDNFGAAAWTVEVEPPAWAESGLTQLQRSAFLDFDPNSEIYTYHPVLLDRVPPHLRLDKERWAAGVGWVLGHYSFYLLAATKYDLGDLDQYADAILALMEIAWEAREDASPYDHSLAAMVDRFSGYLRERGLWQTSKTWHDRAIALRRGSGPKGYEIDPAGALYEKGKILVSQGDPRAAFEALKQAQNLFEEAGHPQGVAAVLYELAVLQIQQGNPTEARDLLQQSSKILEDAGDQRGIASCISRLADLEWQRGDATESRSLLLRSLRIHRTLGDKKGTASCLHRLAVIEREAGDLSRARRLFRRSFAIFESTGDQPFVALSLHELAILERRQGNHTEARRLLQRSAGIFEQLGARPWLASSLHELATIELEQGFPGEARRLWQRSVALHEDIGDVPGHATSLGMLAQMEAMEGNLETALRLAEKSLSLFSRIGGKPEAEARELVRRISSLAKMNCKFSR